MPMMALWSRLERALEDFHGKCLSEVQSSKKQQKFIGIPSNLLPEFSNEHRKRIFIG
jgi:hypothetical protein